MGRLEGSGPLSEFSKGEDFDAYRSNAMLRSAVERQLEIVGEALNQLSQADGDLAAQVPDLGRIVAFRTILIHGYATVEELQDA
ncbi:HepT-like ribonuclease domain-containing protein [Amycolatopsis coloradensis]|uniref:HepT-like ribonuclease domain-containing protein n=1 Tax=Amycolatopsis coloradensis TaxID=76021 RepID=A0ACD5BRM0_9PSEU